MTTPTRTFAPNTPKDENNWFLFPREAEYRRSLFPEAVFDHPAKANIHLIEELWRYLTEPGDSIIDPFGGTGTLLLAAREGRKVVLIDVEEQFVNLQRETVKNWQEAGTELADTYIYHGDNRQVLEQLQFLCDASIFSPPYSTALAGSGSGFQEKDDKSGNYSATMAKSYGKGQLSEYSGKAASALNMGRLNPVYFSQAMNTLYKRLAARLVPNAPMAVITKDFQKGPRRELISEQTIAMAQRNGFQLRDWFKWRPPGSGMQNIAKSKGFNVVLDEDILVFRKKA